MERMHRLRDAGFTEQQVAAILDAIEQATDPLVTRHYLDERLQVTRDYLDERLQVTRDYLDERLQVTRDYLDERLRVELMRCKRSMLLWALAMHAPTYAAVIYFAIKIG